jgi:hypothetical protein
MKLPMPMPSALLVVLACYASADVPAGNDPRANYSDGMFSLPPLEHARDAYLVIISPMPSGDVVTLSLPQGCTGLRVDKDIIPTEAWVWTYKVMRHKPPVISINTAMELSLIPMDIDGDRISLEWKPVAGASTYTIKGERRNRKSQKGNPPWEKFSIVRASSVCERGQVCIQDLALHPGSEVNWSIQAADADGIVLAASDVAHIKVSSTVWQSLEESGFKLQRSDTLSKQAATQPATLILDP